MEFVQSQHERLESRPPCWANSSNTCGSIRSATTTRRHPRPDQPPQHAHGLESLFALVEHCSRAVGGSTGRAARVRAPRGQRGRGYGMAPAHGAMPCCRQWVYRCNCGTPGRQGCGCRALPWCAAVRRRARGPQNTPVALEHVFMSPSDRQFAPYWRFRIGATKLSQGSFALGSTSSTSLTTPQSLNAAAARVADGLRLLRSLRPRWPESRSRPPHSVRGSEEAKDDLAAVQTQ